MKKGWQKLSSFLFEASSSERKQRYSLYLSPYDVPEAIRPLDSGNFVALEFKYIPVNENHIEVTEPELNNLVFEVGEKTGRVYKIKISKLMINSEVEISIQPTEIDSAFEHLARKLGANVHGKYNAAKQATQNYLSRQAVSIGVVDQISHLTH
ncbi:hypothetical protein [Salinivibrio sp. IB872]|uniref:hypothetical protein n=1 Tax=Salinivibrio sp. IB872 TaxID=1766123 RepID=UPI000985FE62|nr:hypothetical protein [Salinivibrio sp. IB872]OOF24694.1 hypothetical protein BZJ18_13025 [Salinivibrio sp. IB872]